MTTAYIGLGSNLGNREDYINSALKMLAEIPDIEVARVSELIETTPLAQADQPEYLNAVAELKASLSSEDLLKRLINIENSLGRERGGKWSSRTIDLDILLFGSRVINSPHLTIPHPEMDLRSFVLKGLCQLTQIIASPAGANPQDSGTSAAEMADRFYIQFEAFVFSGNVFDYIANIDDFCIFDFA